MRLLSSERENIFMEIPDQRFVLTGVVRFASISSYLLFFIEFPRRFCKFWDCLQGKRGQREYQDGEDMKYYEERRIKEK